MTVRSSPKKHSIGILKIALWAGIMFLLIKTLSFAGDKFYAFMSALDARVLLVLIGILMVLIGVLVAALSARKVSTTSFNLLTVLVSLLVLVPIGFGIVLIMSSM